ncbi:R3H and coiled-coil domain-containing protein 1-like [Melipona quadrifasciata]|uniref:R3H and coiled-coil domain-containing protein 1-like n=1 Tax=Melipona quadrifasciata TaxID=166423 RepID=A0A0M8ZXG1_9HYME|nr:R3H and coiled-coil domain-containing protein 1-like [Melipona quadrifasciata]
MTYDYSDLRMTLILRKPTKEKVKRYVKVSRRMVLVFPPVNNYRRYIIHQLVQDRFADLHTFSIGQGSARRTVLCYRSDVIRDPKLNGEQCKPTTKGIDTLFEMGVEGQRSPSASPERVRVQRQVKSTPTVEIYRPPAARRARNELQTSVDQVQIQTSADSFVTKSLETEGSPQPSESARVNRTVKDNLLLSAFCGQSRSSSNVKEMDSEADVQQSMEYKKTESNTYFDNNQCNGDSEVCCQEDPKEITSIVPEKPTMEASNEIAIEQLFNLNKDVPNDLNNAAASEDKCDIIDTEFQAETLEEQEISSNSSETKNNLDSVKTCIYSEINVNEEIDRSDKYKDDSIVINSDANNKKYAEISNKDEITNQKNVQMMRHNMVSNVLIISDTVQKEPEPVKEIIPVPLTSPEKKVKKVIRQKSKPAPPPSPPVKKMNRDECDWDSLFDDNGDCLDPTLIEEASIHKLTSAVGDVMIEQPKSDYKPYTKHIEVSSDEFAHVVEIYNFPSEFKTSDLAAVFSPFKNGGFELKWVDDTHCLGVFSSPLVAAEVLASDHPFVKTRPLSEATALSKTKAKRSAEFLQPYRSRPETCAALARRLVTGALGVKLATARQEREHEKNILREAKEKRRLANKQREDAWEGIIPEK